MPVQHLRFISHNQMYRRRDWYKAIHTLRFGVTAKPINGLVWLSPYEIAKTLLLPRKYVLKALAAPESDRSLMN